MENGHKPRKRDTYISLDEVRRPFPYEMREQRQNPGMRESTVYENPQESMQESAVYEMPQESMQESAVCEMPQEPDANNSSQDDIWNQPEPYDMTNVNPRKLQRAAGTAPRQTAPPPHRTVFSSGKHTWKDFLTASNLLILINVIVYIVVMRQKMPDDPQNILLIYKHGGLYVPAVQKLGEYYRFFTSMFLHFNFSHLLNNMFCLFVMGNMLEEQFGKLRLLAVYLLGGLGGSVGSYLNYLSMTSYPVSAGASGAVFALYGGVLAMVMFDKRVRGFLNPWRFIVLILITIVSQLSDKTIGNTAHFVGFLVGFLVACGIYLIDRKTKRGTYHNGTAA